MKNPTFQIEGSKALVTGANRGIGRAIVDSLVSHGAAKVYAAVRNPQSAEELVKQYPGQVEAIQIDLDQPETISKAAESAADVNVVVNNAGILNVTNALDSNAIEVLSQEMNVNVHGLMRMAQAFAPVLKKNTGGVFVQLNSVASLKSFSGLTTYSMTKAASYSFTQALWVELAEQGTAVISVHPGPINTDMIHQAGEELAAISEPPSLVAEAIVAAMRSGDFHVFPDSMAQQMGEAYRDYAEAYIEADE